MTLKRDLAGKCIYHKGGENGMLLPQQTEALLQYGRSQAEAGLELSPSKIPKIVTDWRVAWQKVTISCMAQIMYEDSSQRLAAHHSGDNR